MSGVSYNGKTKTSYNLIGADPPLNTVVSSSFRIFTIASVVGLFLIAFVYALVIGITTTRLNDSIRNVEDDIVTLNETLLSEISEGDALLYENITLLNETLCTKIMEGDARLEELILNINYACQ